MSKKTNRPEPVLTDEQIDKIAEPYIKAYGDHFCYEDAISWRDVDYFARDIEKAVIAKYVKQLDAADRDAEKEAADLRAWRKGLVRPGTEQPERWPVVVDVNQPEDIRLSVGRIGDSERWFDPREIFEAADRDAEKEGE